MRVGVIGLVGLVMLGAFGASLRAGEVLKPNIVYFLVDDMGYADTGFNGCQDIRTPNIDKLAKQGAILDAFHRAGTRTAAWRPGGAANGDGVRAMTASASRRARWGFWWGGAANLTMATAEARSSVGALRTVDARVRRRRQRRNGGGGGYGGERGSMTDDR